MAAFGRETWQLTPLGVFVKTRCSGEGGRLAHHAQRLLGRSKWNENGQTSPLLRQSRPDCYTRKASRASHSYYQFPIYQPLAVRVPSRKTTWVDRKQYVSRPWYARHYLLLGTSHLDGLMAEAKSV